MSKNEIVFEKEGGNLNESDLIDQISKKEFFNWMEKHGYGYDEIKEVLDSKRLCPIEQNNFNTKLRLAKKEIKVNLTNSLVFLEETFVKFKKILSILDNETKFELKKELSENYKIKIDQNNLIQILG